ncbi:phosphatase PAP2 family protein [Kribbella sp. NPDC023972]|uniref:phosphatase PAP2 family protein n=1 Tax=Kribbella sp. NPDC023972 TaxID=3154795 RepID=UPI0033FF49AE
MTDDPVKDTVRPRAAVRPALVPALRRPAVGIAILGTVLVAVPAVLFAGSSKASALDASVQQAVGEPAAIAWKLDWLGEPVGRALMVLAVVAICLLARRRALAAMAAVGVVATSLLTSVLKPIVDRRIHDNFLSYPSGHTAAVTAAAIVLGLLLADLLHAGPMTGTAIVLAAAVVGGGLMAWAQIALSAHYPTDALGGFGCALLVIPLTASVTDRLVRIRMGRPAPR